MLCSVSNNSNSECVMQVEMYLHVTCAARSNFILQMSRWVVGQLLGYCYCSSRTIATIRRQETGRQGRYLIILGRPLS